MSEAQQFRPTHQTIPLRVRAVQLTEAMVHAAILDGQPLPRGVRLGGHSCHPGRREVYQFNLRMDNKSGDAAVGDWICEDQGGYIFRVSAGEFATRYQPIQEEPAHA